MDLIEEPPEGYYAFIESPGAEPPKVRRPPYVQSEMECPGLQKNKGKYHSHVYKTLSLCGDLNKGYIPKNPMEQNVLGSAYPFDLIKNKTLQFFSKALPILKADETLPKVAKYQQFEENGNKISKSLRKKRSTDDEENTSSYAAEDIFSKEIKMMKRAGRKFCENNDGVLCLIYKVFQGDSPATTSQAFYDRKSDQVSNETPEFRRGESSLPVQHKEKPLLPPTPCPAKVEYATPVFARNYQGVWRYVVQIPYEGYFTQTIEVTRCLNSRCHYLDGNCMSSPRWTSILVAEIYYPDKYLPAKPSLQSSSWPGQNYRNPVSSENPPPVQDFQNYQQYLQKRAGLSDPGQSTSSNESKKSVHCDGVDEIGCFQVRLYYDWFLVPGSCKCWKPDYFSNFVRRKSSPPEL
ncbi:hypothetical protein RUM43_004274 [Polyplax serrata]|uniref:Uncharacterized protein n=1 Tax=Polyplax serrata TaxID=468196 RepID=A0AAN8SBL2_POLSC